MNQSINKIKSYFSGLRKKEVSYDKAIVSPTRDWNIMIIGFSISILISAVTAFYVYNKIDSSTFVSIDPAKKESETKINVDLLNKIVSDVRSRSAGLEKIKSGEIAVPQDPSL
jgi:hypothetical protein